MTGNRTTGPLAGGLAALLLAAPAAWAADIPGDKSTKAVLKVTNVVTWGSLDRPTDTDWYRIALTKGQDYAIRIITEPDSSPGSVTLRDSAGRKLRSEIANTLGDNGFEFRATYTGTYFVDVYGEWNPTYPGPQPYGVAVVRDCRGDATTKCTLAPGKTYQVGSAWFADYDSYVQALDSAKRYTFTGTVAPDGYCYLDMKLLDGTGAVLASASSPWYGADPAVIKDFRPPKSGKYYLRLRCDSDDWGGTYTVGMTVR